MTGAELVKSYLDRNYKLVFWSSDGDQKGPTESGWPTKQYQLSDYKEGDRVGALTGVEISPGRFLHDVDIDWQAGSIVAMLILPLTSFVFGRASKKISHCFYTLPEPLPSMRFEDIDGTCLIELRGTKSDSSIGLQTMIPPSVWSKNGTKEPLTFVRSEGPTHIEAQLMKERVIHAAIALIFAKHFGHNGFGHDVRLCWAGFLLRAGLSIEELVRMGEAISTLCNNNEVKDVRRSIESTAKGLESEKKKVKGGPSLIRILGSNGRKVLARVNEWLGRNQDFVRNQKGLIIAKHHGNIVRAIEIIGEEFSFNDFAYKPLMNGKPLIDYNISSLRFQVSREFHFEPEKQYFQEVIEDIAWNNRFHPVKDYLEALQWDGNPRIDTWLIRAAEADDTPYVRAVSSIMLIAGVRRIRHPGCKYDEMVVWESPQGSDKSSAARALCPNPEWFSDDLRLNVHSKELIESTLGKWIIEASDLAGKRKAEIEQLKAMMSRQVDGPARLAWRHFAEERQRHFILVGTTNSAIYLNDPTGSRRFWPVTVKRFQIDWIIKHRDQLWAEACVREAKGESIRLPEELWPHAGDEQEKRREIDPWEDAIREVLANVPIGLGGRRRVQTSDIWDAIGVEKARQDRYGANRISDIMQRLGYKRTRVRVGETVQVGYVQEQLDRGEPEVGVEEIEVKNDQHQKDDIPF